MNKQNMFSCADFALLRAPVQPISRLRETTGDGLDNGFGDEVGAAIESLRTLAADALVGEAVLVSSGSLAHGLKRVLLGGDRDRAGETPRPADLHRMMRALLRYRLRMSTRSTPFGLMAGVAQVEFTSSPDEVKVHLGDRHRRVSRPDREWLSRLAADWERSPEVLTRLRLVRNNLCFVRGTRLILPYQPETDTAGKPERLHEISVRHTEAVRAILEAAAVPVAYPHLRDRLVTSFPQAPSTVIDAVLLRLVDKGFLLTELPPPPHSVDPVGHMLEVLADGDAAESPERRGLAAIRAGLVDYDETPLGEGTAAWEAVTAQMRSLRPGNALVQVDLVLDADVRLPTSVGVEIERAAGLLWQLAPTEDDPGYLREYHADFVERYGLERLVPLKELLDPNRGLGAPAGYQRPPSSRQVRPPHGKTHGHEASQRDRMLADLVQSATASGRSEVELTDDHPVVRELATGTGRPPDSIDLCAQLFADSVDALAAGRFTAVIAGWSERAGSMIGRFAHLSPSVRQALSDLSSDAVGTSRSGFLPAQVAFHPFYPRLANVASVPPLLPHTIPVAVFADQDNPATLNLDRLAVGALPDRLFVVDRDSGRQIAPAAFDVINDRTNAPNAARFLREVQHSGVRLWQGWSWGSAEALTHLPRVRYGRTVLSPARWRPDPVLCDKRAGFDDWSAALDRWKEHWRVPSQLCLSYLDQRIELDLDSTAHRHLLRHELERRPTTVLRESFRGVTPAQGWLAGPGGSHHNEVVFALTRRTPDEEPRRYDHHRRTHERAMSTVRKVAEGEQPPGGEWVYALLHCPAEQHDELLVDEVAPLIEQLPEGVDRWFFIRYHDTAPHLRLRIHGTDAVRAELTDRVRDWAARLRRLGMINRVAFDTYDPEWERYGGPDTMAGAEQVFHADSVVALEKLRLRNTGQLRVDPLLLQACNHIDLIRAFSHDPEEAAATAADRRPEPWMHQLLDRTVRLPEHRAFQQRRQEAMALVDPWGGWNRLRAEPGSATLLRCWADRASTVSAYRKQLDQLGPHSWSSPPDVQDALLHMQHNRLFGVSPESERQVLAIVRGVVQSAVDRWRKEQR
ncbi:lantibiotic dehydratase [Streptomyces sp. SL13]|uniref:Lantibiotic dehydratase n=1 Tax=Streptantibioticus silvisoli TaxID=2705255 RepID=A0AA90KG95_9ACTN|nr:lantibiotic dehydratase [Streptantibioticus silvisoli]MDI5969884.1 lantibiotic dehydratase [Streptantibioticus silvisoli]